MKKRFVSQAVLLLLAVLLCVGLALPACAEESQEAVTIKVAFYPLDGFFEYDETGSECGYGVDYLHELEKYANINWQFVPVDSWEGIKQLMLDGKVDVRMPVSEPTVPSGLYSYTTEPVLPSYHALLTRTDRTDLYYQDYDEIGKMRIAITQGLMEKTGMEDYLTSIGVRDHLITYDDYNACRAALDEGLVDGLITNIMDLTEDLKILDKFAVTKNYITTLKDNPCYHVINNAMTQLELENPAFQSDLYEQYYPERSVEPFTRVESEYIQNTDSLTVAVFPDRRPMTYYDESTGTFRGIAIDLAEEISRKIGIPFNYVPIVTDTPREMLDRVDLVMPVDQNDDSGQYFATPSLLDMEIQLAMRDGMETVPEQGRVGVLTSTANVSRLLDAHTDYELVQYADNQQALKDLQRGKIDAFANVSYVLNWNLENPRYGNLHLQLYQGMPIGYAICGRAKDVTLRSILFKAVGALSDQDCERIIKADTAFSLADLSMTDRLYMYRTELAFGGTVLILLLLAVAAYNHVRNRSVRELEQRSTELEKANNAKNDFLARMSHDMRTPMNGILGLSYIMEEQIGRPELKSELEIELHQLRDSGEYLLQLINDVLDIDKVESGRLELHPRPCDEEQLFDSITRMIEPQMQKKHIDFTFEKKNIEWKWMLLDAPRTKQIFLNLLGNAVKFTPEGGKIDFVMELVSQDENMIRDKFIVRDNGIGMSEEFVQRAFEPFAQENRAQEGLGGTGLGLSIVKNLVELMGGSISVTSRVNEGSEFVLYLNFPLTQHPLQEQEKSAAVLPGGLRLLLCEDHPLNAKIAAALLEKQGATVTWVKNGRQGVESFAASETGGYDAVLMDIRMPEMNGIEAAQAIRNLPRPDAKTVPIIAMTANAYDEDVQKSLDAGMNAHLAKPVEPQRLYDTLAECLVGVKKPE